MSIMNEALKATQRRESVTASIIEPMNETVRAKRPLSHIFMAISFAMIAVLFLVERDRRLQRESELSIRDAQVESLTQQNQELEVSLKSRIELLELTLSELNQSFDVLLQQKKTLEADSLTKDDRLAELSSRVLELEHR